MQRFTLDKNILYLTIIMSLNWIGLFMIVPIYTPLILNQHSMLLTQHIGIEYRKLILGMLISIFGVAQLVSSPTMGALSDRFSRKKLISAALFIGLIGYVVGMISLIKLNIGMVFLSRILIGISSAITGLLFACVSDLYDGRMKQLAMGYLSGGSAIGAILGPIIGSRLITHNVLYVPFLILSVTYLIAIILFKYFYSPPDKVTVKNDDKLLFKKLLGLRKLTTLLLGYFFFVLSVESIFLSVPIHVVEYFGLGAKFIGNLFFIEGLAALLSSVFMNKILTSFFSSRANLILSLLSLTFAYLLFVMIQTPSLMYIGMLIMGTSCVLGWAYFNACISGAVLENQRGLVLGISQSLVSCALIIGPVIVAKLSAIHSTYGLILSLSACIISLLCYIIYCCSAS